MLQIRNILSLDRFRKRVKNEAFSNKNSPGMWFYSRNYTNNNLEDLFDIKEDEEFHFYNKVDEKSDISAKELYQDYLYREKNNKSKFLERVFANIVNRNQTVNEDGSVNFSLKLEIIGEETGCKYNKQSIIGKNKKGSLAESGIYFPVFYKDLLELSYNGHLATKKEINEFHKYFKQGESQKIC